MGRNPLNAVAAPILVGFLAVAPVVHAGDGPWRPLDDGTSPTASLIDAAAFDPVRDRLYVYDYLTPDRIWFYRVSGQKWSTFVPAGTAPPQIAATLTYDAVNDRIVMIDFDSGGPNPVVYTVNLAGTPTWHTFTPPDGPSPRSHPSLAYDPLGPRLLVYGGADGTIAQYDTWMLGLQGDDFEWVKLYNFGGPQARELSQAIYDPVGDRLVVHGGINRTENGVPLRDVWALSLAGTPEWTQLADAGGPDRYGAAVAYDAAHRRMVIFGGTSAQGSNADTWGFDLDTDVWTPIAAGNPPESRTGPHGAIEPDGRFLVYGGRTSDRYENDLWSLASTDGAIWSLVHADPQFAIDRRRDAVLVYDPLRRRAVLSGGSSSTAGIDGGTWVLEPRGERFTQIFVTVSGTASPHRSGAAGIWDPVRDRLIEFGGLDGAPSHDVVALDGATSNWSAVSMAIGGAQPPDVQFAAGAYDAVRHRALFFGGAPTTIVRNALWSLSLGTPSAWLQLSPTGVKPSWRTGHTFTADAGHDRVILFGGGDGGVTNDLFLLTLTGSGAWTRLIGPDTPPPARAFHAAIFDSVGDRLIVWGGKDGAGNYLDDTWEYRFDGGGGWREMAPAARPPGAIAAGIYQPDLQRMLVYGGENAEGPARETWAMDLAGQTTAVPDGAEPVAFALQGATPNPSFRAPSIAFTLPDASSAKLELIDVLGRRVRAVDVGPLGAGRHVVDLARGGAIAPGLYFARLTRGGEARTARVCVME